MTEEFYRIKLEDAGWLVRNVRCADACPVHTRAGRYITLMADGMFEDAYRFARMPNPFASACGRICAHPCEEACNRGRMDAPLAIRALKRFLTERFGVESQRALDLKDRLALKKLPQRSEKVAIIGAGPAGLACANDLALLGYSPVIFEAAPAAGGMLLLGVPEYRLSRQLLQREIDFIANLGVKINLNTKIGRDISLSELRQTYDALFIACGAQKARDLPIEGKDFDGVLKGIDFLRDINLGSDTVLGKTVVVVGGGNVAFDVARTAIRQVTVASDSELSTEDPNRPKPGRQAGTPLADEGKAAHEVLDVARAARFLGAEVHLVCLEPKSAMLADDEEVVAAGEEGIFIHNSRGPKRIVGEDGKAVGLETLAVKSIFDDKGRFRPTFYEGSEELIKADTVILAIGQAIDTTFIGPEDDIEISPQGAIKVDPVTLSTTAERIFSGGDSAFGPRIVINAIADGRTAAKSIHSLLTGKPIPEEVVKYTALHRRHYFPRGDYDRRERTWLPMMPVERRIGIVEVELSLDEAAALQESGRCLRCFYNVSINPNKCVLCGRCAEACPMKCIKMVSLDRIELNEEERAYIENSQPEFFSEENGNLPALAMVQDEEACIRCGQCVAACPADACTMMRIELDEGGVALAKPEGLASEGGQASGLSDSQDGCHPPENRRQEAK